MKKNYVTEDSFGDGINKNKKNRKLRKRWLKS